MKRIPILAAILLASAALAAEAAPNEGGGPGGPGGPLQRLKAADTNGDGMLSRDEAAALPRIREHFDEIDANKDGFVSFEELRAFHEKMRGDRVARMQDHFKKMDADGDGRISRAEAAAFPRLAEHFDEIDANKDGFVTPDELRGARARHQK